MDWAAMVMQMYKLWAQQRRYKVTVVDEMPGEIAGIKVHLLTSFCLFLSLIKLIVVMDYLLVKGNWQHSLLATYLCCY